jgi:hypothetical protein
VPLPTDPLKTAHVDTSKNPYLKPLWKAVSSYNATGGLGRTAELSKRFDAFRSTGKMPAPYNDQMRRAAALQDIMYHAASFLTCKPPNPDKAKRHPRWDAMSQLMNEVNLEAARIGVKLVDSPTDFRTIGSDKGSVWLEVIDPMHREFGALSELYEEWTQNPKAQAENQSFWKYIGDDRSDAVVLYDLGAKSHIEKGPHGKFTEMQGHDVDTTSAETLQPHGPPNRGWGIFAVTVDGELHVGRHSNEDLASVRHTSLTGGQPILAAGEICIVQGKIAAISNLTGHYKLGAPQFLNWLSSSPLLTPDVLVKARIGVTYPVVKENESNPDIKTTTMASTHIVAAASVDGVRDWVSNGKPNDESQPFGLEGPELRNRVNDASWGDVNYGEEKEGAVIDW